MHKNQFRLLGDRNYLPFFIAQTFQGFNDSVFRLAVLALISFYLTTTANQLQYWQSMAIFLYNVPFLIFSVFAGQLADKYRKDTLIKMIKFAEVILAILAMVVIHYAKIPWMMFTIFLYGLFTAFFVPIKYATLPELVDRNRLLGANALVEASALLAIALGSVVGSLASPDNSMHYYVLLLVVALSLFGWVASLFLPKVESSNPHNKINLNLFSAISQSFGYAREHRSVFIAIIGIGWFWFVGATFYMEYPLYVRFMIHGSHQVFTLFLLIFTTGIFTGTLIVNTLLDGKVSAKYTALCSLIIAIACIDLYFAGFALPLQKEVVVKNLFSQWRYWRLMADVAVLALALGVYVVPLYTLLQVRSEPDKRARIMAVNTIVFSLFMVAASIFLFLLKYWDIDAPTMFLIVGLMSIGMTGYLMRIVPRQQIKTLFRWGLKIWYRVEVKGLNNYNLDSNAVIVANQVSKLDFLLLSAFLPDEMTLTLHQNLTRRMPGRVLTCLANLVSVDSSRAHAAKALIKAARKGQRIILFPENRLTGSANQLKIYEGPGFVIDKSKANILPVRISGAQSTLFSLTKHKNVVRFRPKITIHIMSPIAVEHSEGKCSQQHRQELALKLYDLIRDMTVANAECDKSLFQALLDGRKLAKQRGKIIEDMQRQPVSYSQFVARCFILGRKIKTQTKPGEHVGVMLPTSLAGMITLFGLQAYRRIPAMLNFTAGFYNLNAACITAEIKTIYTSRQFVNTAKINDVVKQLAEAGLKIVYLEDFRKQIGLHHKISGLLKGLMPAVAYRFLGKAVNPVETAMLLFTSGSEGIPKGVALSHKNILSNVAQLIASVDFSTKDIFFNSLPIFHSFGLTAGAILPVTTGNRAFFYPSPLHYKIIPGLVYDVSATIMFATDTFLTGYAHYAKPTDFNSIRYIFAGAEKVRPETMSYWIETFGARIFEGYGATEASPVIAVNTPTAHLRGSVGQVLPGIQYQIKPVEGITQGGRLHVKGPNVMIGYLRADNPGVIEHLDDWYDTGDIVDVDINGFITILGRAKRFAKIGGEMVSLTAVEGVASSVWSEMIHAAIIKRDPKRGEQIVLLTENQNANKKELTDFIREQGMSEMLVPKELRIVDKIPVLASGKIDYVTLQRDE